ncbi:MAG: hypothetical protein FWD58_05225 [Firmicutes bacterium]|nr:hypothetical protein [Bacillota bacterium]
MKKTIKLVTIMVMLLMAFSLFACTLPINTLDNHGESCECATCRPSGNAHETDCMCTDCELQSHANCCECADCKPENAEIANLPDSDPYGAGGGNIAIFGATRIGVDFWRAEGLDDIDNLKIWHQLSDRGNWIEYSIIWMSERSALVEFANRVNSPAFLGVLGAWGDTAVEEMLEAYSEFFFANCNLVLVSMTEGVLTTGISKTGICESGAVDITRTIFDDDEAISLGISLTIGFPVPKSFTPTHMSINATTNVISRADTPPTSANKFVNFGSECTCDDWASRPIQVWVVLDTHLHLWVPFANSQDRITDMLVHRENSQRFHTTINTTFLNEIGLDFDSDKYSITMSYFSPFNIVTFYTVEAFNDFIELMQTVTKSSVAQGVSVARACNNPEKWRDEGSADGGGDRK